MATDLFINAVTGDIASSANYNTNFDLVQNSLSDLGPFVVSGLTLTAGAGLAVTVAAGVASIGGRITAAAPFSIAGLANGQLNYLYLKDDGTGTSNLTGTNPADSVKLGTATTSGGVVTSTNILRDSGRQAKVRSESLVPGGPSAGNPASINLAAWAAAAANSVTVYGTLPAGALPSIAFDDLSDVTLTSQARGDIVYRGASAWLNLAAGTSGRFLKTQGAGADPIWSSLSGLLALDDLTDVNLPTASQGDILYRNATEWVRLTAGTNGQPLVTSGAAANPAWSSSVGALTVTGALTCGAISGTSITVPGAGASSEIFGASSAAAGANSTAVGNAASASATRCVAMGRLAAAGVTQSVAVGYNASAGGTGNVAIGDSSSTTGTYGVALGVSAVGTNGGLAIGSATSSSANGAIALGHFAISSVVNQLVIGGGTPNGTQITDVYIGANVTDTAPPNLAIHATGGSGTDKAGASFTLAGGKATGNVAGGDIIFQSTRSGQGSASTLRSLEELLRLSNAGVLTFTQHTSTSDRSALDVTPTWATSTDASRKARSVFNVWDTAAREALRLEASGSAAMIGFLGASAIARPSSYTLAGSATRTMPTDPSSSYTGIDNLQVGTPYAAVADLNTLRAVVSSLEGVVRQILADFTSYGLLQ